MGSDVAIRVARSGHGLPRGPGRAGASTDSGSPAARLATHRRAPRVRGVRGNTQHAQRWPAPARRSRAELRRAKPALEAGLRGVRRSGAESMDRACRCGIRPLRPRLAPLSPCPERCTIPRGIAREEPLGVALVPRGSRRLEAGGPRARARLRRPARRSARYIASLACSATVRRSRWGSAAGNIATRQWSPPRRR